ncbi:hypothetical protein SAMD00019534_052550 [Acytostelium subglobosum LB1]|uniref:hypothetical protein n=1 Tax=Acytostelium subglobosum LB1 TaxID=1410327 RepID=UPI00064504F9|nr:hypothetical protein SAMD00019534_052550 [Acytostelium subglobosum LB1]GAM22080.1 hypothetical protein SAMD00019534_052550 [Acytostelium subglobosum LB1]|eukprot:XP_012755180.1 hypothetical protein SAMD00019534_052550 [Acytostelium subglobosum LB1]
MMDIVRRLIQHLVAATLVTLLTTMPSVSNAFMSHDQQQLQQTMNSHQSYIAITGYSMTTYFLSGYCHLPLEGGKAYMYTVLPDYTVHYAIYNDENCRSSALEHNETIATGKQPNHPWIQVYLVDEVNVTNRAHHFTWTYYATGRQCNGIPAIAYSQPIGNCLPRDFWDPWGKYQTIMCHPSGKTYTQTIYEDRVCTERVSEYVNVLESTCNTAQESCGHHYSCQ